MALSVAPQRPGAPQPVVDDVNAGIAFSCLVDQLARTVVSRRKPSD